MTDKIAILGTAVSSRLLAPFKDPEWKIWACSPANNDLPRVDTWFELHSPHTLYDSISPQYMEVLKKHPDVYVQSPIVEIPHAKIFPAQDLVKQFDPYYFTSTVAWMIAFAITQNPKEIGLWGVDMSATEEYGFQRSGCRELLKEAMRRGIEVNVPLQSDLMNNPPLYGYSDNTPLGAKIYVRRKELLDKQHYLEGLVSEHKAKLDFFTNNLHFIKGAIEDLDYFSKNWT